MDIRDLPLSEDLVAHYETRGVESLYPPQERAVQAGVADGESVVASVPTASGKTLVAELAMHTAPGTALYIVPLRALAAEKYHEFRERPGVDVGVATGDYDASPTDLAAHDVVVATCEKVDSLVRAGASWLSEVGCVVVDEVHLLDSRERGPTLEVTLAKLRRLAPAPQVVALSATVANADAIADWLDAELVASEWRPIELRAGVYHDGTVDFEDGTGRSVPADDGRATPALIRDVLGDGGQCLVFVHSRRAAEELARAFAAEWFGAASDVADAIADAARTDTGRALADCVRDGVAFHHAGLRTAHRTLVEDAFRDRDVDVLCATPTLAAGVNVPARRVVVRDHHRYTDRGREPLSVLEVHQMFGRAGRPGLDPRGEAVLVADSAAEAASLRERYVDGDPEPVASKLASQDALRTHVLATVASGFAADRADLLSVLEETFYAAQADHATLVDIADLVLDYLADVDMLRTGDGLAATDLGETVSRLYVDPRTAATLLDDLESLSDRGAPSTVALLEAVCVTPEVPSLYLRDGDRAATYRFAEANATVFLRGADGREGTYDEWLSALKTVRVLADWMDGVDEQTLADRHGVGPGDLRTAVERAGWLLNAAETLARHRGLPVADRVAETRERIESRAEDGRDVVQSGE